VRNPKAPGARNQSGQAVVEYMLMLLTVISVVSIMGFGFRKSLFALWQSFARDIAAACPGCPPPSNVKIR
jgi:Flp pilus assembly pilin Flp